MTPCGDPILEGITGLVLVGWQRISREPMAWLLALAQVHLPHLGPLP